MYWIYKHFRQLFVLGSLVFVIASLVAGIGFDMDYTWMMAIYIVYVAVLLCILIKINSKINEAAVKLEQNLDPMPLLSISEKIRHPSLGIGCLNYAVALYHLGRIDEAIEALGVMNTKAVKDPFTMFVYHSHMVAFHNGAPKVEGALSAAEEWLLRIKKPQQREYAELILLSMRIRLAIGKGDIKTAEELLPDFVKQGEKASYMFRLGARLTAAEVYLMKGEREEARQLFIGLVSVAPHVFYGMQAKRLLASIEQE